MTQLTPKKVERFLTALRAGGSVSEAATVAGATRQGFYARRQRDPAFAEAWAEALDEGTDCLEAEARRRAVNGVERPVFYRGDVVGYVRRYSDALLMFLLKSRRPEQYCPNYHRPENADATDDIVERLLAGRRRAAEAHQRHRDGAGGPEATSGA